MAMRLFFHYNNQLVKMPVNPNNIELRGRGDNQTVNIVSLGEVNLLNPRQLNEFEVRSFFPSTSNAPYVLTRTDFRPPQFYIDFFNGIREDENPVLFVLSDTNISMLVSVEVFDYRRKHGTDDIDYTLRLKEYKQYSTRTVTVSLNANRANVAPPRPAPATSTPITIGARVIVNGRLHRDSFGGGPGQAEINATRLVNFIQKGRSHPYHVTNLEGGWRGWVTADSVRRA